MGIATTCQCGARFTAKDELAGKTLSCPTCNMPLTVPGGEEKISVSCLCGASYQVAPSWVGKRVRCKKCDESFVVEAPASDPFGLPFDMPGMPAMDAMPAMPTMDAVPTMQPNPLAPAAFPTRPAPQPAQPPASSDRKLFKLIAIGGGVGVVGLVLLIGVLVMSGLFSGGSGGGRGYDSPEAAYAAVQSAVEQQDWGKLYDSFTPQTQKTIAGMCVLRMALNPERNDALIFLANKYKIDPGTVLTARNIPPNEYDLRSMVTPTTMYLSGEELKDERSLVIETLTHMHDQMKNESSNNGGAVLRSPFTSDRFGPLAGLQMLGDSAQARVGKRLIRFEQKDGKWKVDLMTS